MAKSAYDRFPAARAVFDEADAVLNFSLSTLCFSGPEAELQLTANSQPAILTASIALLRALQESTGFEPTVVAGHSLGEYSALVCAGAMSFADAVRTVRARGQFMQEAVPTGLGSMAAVKATLAEVEALCRDAAQSEVLAPANHNSPRQIVIAGHASAIARAVKLAGERGLACKELKVSAPFHCALMQGAADKLRAELAKVKLSDAKVPVISNVDAVAYQKAGDIIDRLVRQVTSPVKWDATVRELTRLGAKEIIEIGPGKVLSGLVKQCDPTLKSSSCESSSDVDALKLASAKNPSTKDWGDMNEEERDEAAKALIDFDTVMKRFDAKPHDIYRWMMVFKMPTWLVEGELRFHPAQLEAWLQQVGGIETIKKKEAEEAAQQALADAAAEAAKQAKSPKPAPPKT
jgi:[acyl-carrier-protein] S-malonyltransferase